MSGRSEDHAKMDSELHGSIGKSFKNKRNQTHPHEPSSVPDRKFPRETEKFEPTKLANQHKSKIS